MQKIPTLFVRDYETIITGFDLMAVSTMPDGSHSMMSKVTESKKGRFLATNQDNAQFEKCIKAALVAHRKFVGIMQLTGDQKYKEIVEQLKQIR